MINQKICGLVGLARNAGRVVIGLDNIYDACDRGTCSLIITAADAAKNASKKALNISKLYEVPLAESELTKSQLGHAIGFTEAAVIGIAHRGFAKAIIELFKGKE